MSARYAVTFMKEISFRTILSARSVSTVLLILKKLNNIHFTADRKKIELMEQKARLVLKGAPFLKSSGILWMEGTAR